VDVTRACALLAALAPALSGCGAGYLLQAAGGQFEVVSGRRPIERVIADPATPQPLRGRLEVLRDARAFASQELGLPDNRSYTTYTELDRPYVVWSVVATPELSVEPLQWCFPVVGCVAYRGYFREQAAEDFAAGLRRGGHDARVGGVPAYSTLGRFADPLLSTMLRYGDDEVVGTLFHELAHQVAYLPGDSAFNEAFAVAVEHEGLSRWLRARGRPQDLERHSARIARQRELLALLRARRERLAALYSGPGDPAAKRAGKAAEFAALADELRAFATRHGSAVPFAERLERGLNNADLAAVATYWDCVPAFERLLDGEGGDLARFYARVRALVERPRDVRGRWCPSGGATP
jgi:predicted aminopeptidase